MTVLQNPRVKIKGNGAAPLSTPHNPATVVPLPVAQPKKRKSLFARQIWSVEHKPSFARSSIYGFAR